jgi:hypothetical protein
MLTTNRERHPTATVGTARSVRKDESEDVREQEHGTG